MPYKNHDDLIAAKKRYREANKEKVAASNKAYYEKRKALGIKPNRDPERRKKSLSKWMANRTPEDLEKRRKLQHAVSNARRARLKKAKVGRVTAKDLSALLESQGYRCKLCGTDISAKKDLDHIMPIARGGSHTLEKLQYLCPPCNRRKWAHVPLPAMLSAAVQHAE